MHGLIFAGLRDYTVRRLGEDAAARLWSGGGYETTKAYGDDEFRTRLEDIGAATGDDLESLQRDFGAFAAETTFAALYPDYYAANPDALTFLLGVEERIHTIVRATIPTAQPPRLHVRELGTSGVLVSYTSERRLCCLLEGLVHGIGRHYGNVLTTEEIQCMHRGDPGCVFTVVCAD